MPGHDIIVIGASMGGIEALTHLARFLPANLPAAVLVTQHIAPDAPSYLPELLSHAGALPAFHPHDGQDIQHGRIYVAPPNLHLLIERGYVRVIRGPRENHARPAIDPLFRSAARAYGPRVIGVILTGALDDGTAGMLAIKRRGGIAVVQDPKDALVASMPASALEYVHVDYCLPLSDVPGLLARLAQEPAEKEETYPVPRDMDIEARVAAQEPKIMASNERPGELSALTCPECSGPLWEMHDGELMRFRCRQGHAYTAESMLVGQMEGVEDALWAAINVLDENVRMIQKLAQDARQRKYKHVAARFEERLQEQLQKAALLRRVVLNSNTTASVHTDASPASTSEERETPVARVETPPPPDQAGS